jgi:N-acetylmuramoyl-L-alanine amidase
VRTGDKLRQVLAAGLALALPAAAQAAGASARAAADLDRFDSIVIDAGHGGEDEGARGANGLLEKELVLDVARGLAARLRRAGLRVVMTRERDVFVPLEERTHRANDARADLFVSIHANAAHNGGARGSETYFMSLEASDEHARGVALRENEAFASSPGASAGEGDPLVAILGDLIANEHLMESSDFARGAQLRLARLDGGLARREAGALRVLAGVQMPRSWSRSASAPGEARSALARRREPSPMAGRSRVRARPAPRCPARRGAGRGSRSVRGKGARDAA